MAATSANPIDEIKARIEIADLVAPYATLKRSGANFSGLCPFHNERTPSFYVYPATWSYHCFGCGVNGDGFSIVMQKEGLDFRGALERLAAQAGVELQSSAPSQISRDRLQRLRAAMDEAEAFFRIALATEAGDVARDALYQRKIGSETQAAWGIGYAPGGWDALLKYLRGIGFQDSEILEAGLASVREAGDMGERRVYDRFRNRLIIPIRDQGGQTIAFGARALVSTDNPKYLNSPDGPLFTKGDHLYGLDRAAKAVQAAGEIVLVEGYFDVIQLHQAGHANVVAPMGTAMTERQARTLARLAKRVVLALDSDAAGQAATLRGLATLEAAADERVVALPTWQGYVRLVGEKQLDIRVLALPHGKDPDELVRTDPAAWPTAVAASKPVMDHIFSAALAPVRSDDALSKSAAARTLFPAIDALPDPVVRDHYLQRLSDALGVSKAALGQLRPKPAKGRKPGSQSTEPTVLPLPPVSRERFLLALLLRHESLPPDELGVSEHVFEGAAERDFFLRLRGDASSGIEESPLFEFVAAASLDEMDVDTARRAVASLLREIAKARARRRLVAVAAEDPAGALPLRDDLVRQFHASAFSRRDRAE